MVQVVQMNSIDDMQSENMSHSQMLGKFEYGGGPIFKVVLEC